MRTGIGSVLRMGVGVEPPSGGSMRAAMKLDKKSLSDFARDQRAGFESALKDFVEIPSVSSEPERLPDIRRSAELEAKTRADLRRWASILETEGNPLVHGRFDAGAAAPTVTIYNHLDVQPASRETEPWNTDPFAFTKEGDRYFGRGTTDDKGPALTALWGIRAAREAGVRANLCVLWELGGGMGSPKLR